MTASNPPARRYAPVRDPAADTLWLILIATMSVTVLVTRVYLELTGYPQVGDSTYHVAHVLWGGLLLFLAVGLMLSLLNRWAFFLGAILGGIGAGLFIDEVGKFITQSNDYFFPLAFPIIYSFILVCVWFYYRIRRFQPRDTRTLLYHGLEDMKEVLDHDLDPFEFRDLVAALSAVELQASEPNERHLARALLTFVQSREVRLAMAPNRVEQALRRLRQALADRPPRRLLKAVLVLGFGLKGAHAALELTGLRAAATGAGPLFEAFNEVVVVSGKAEYVVSHPLLVLASTLAVIGLGFLALLAAVLLLVGHEKLALRLGVLSLVVALSVVNLFTFYFNQLYAIVLALSQLLLLAVASLYRWRYLGVGSPERTAEPPLPPATS